jgi:hypothetical protein
MPQAQAAAQVTVRATQMEGIVAPDGMISVEEFGKLKGITAEKVVDMIRDGFYVGRKQGEDWYIDKSELEGSATGRMKTFTSPRVQPPAPDWEVSGCNGADYQTRIVVSQIVLAIGWLTCVVAVIIVFTAFSNLGRMGAVALAPAFGVLTGGLLLVLAGQASRTLVDIASSAKQILQEMQKRPN